MTLLAALSSAAAVYLIVGAFLGRVPELRRLRPRLAAVPARQTWLIQAGTDLTPRQFWVGSLVVAGATFAVLVGLTATPATAVVPATAVGLLPRAHFARQRSARMRELQEAWPDGIRDLVANTSAGTSLNQAIEALATSGPEALQTAFVRYPGLARMVGVAPALEILKEELADPTSDRVIEVLILAHERGGHILSDILRDLASATTRDVRAQEEIETDGLEQRINARAVFALPWLVLLVLTVQDGFFRDFYRSPAGLLVVIIGALLSTLGIVVVSRLARDPVEQRVLGAAAAVTPRDGELR